MVRKREAEAGSAVSGDSESLLHRKKNSGIMGLDPVLLFVLCLLLAAGLLILFSATRYIDQKEHPENPYYTITRQALFLLAAFFSMLCTTRISLRYLLSAAIPGYVLSVLLSILVLFVGKEVNGQKRWFALGPISFQPAELAKLMLILILTKYFHGHYRQSRRYSLIIGAMLLTLPLFLPVVEANLSSGLILAGIAFFMTFTASDHKKFLAMAALAVVFLCVFAFQSGILEQILDEYQMNRIYAWLDPEAFPLSNGFQILQGLYAIGAGGVFGVGTGGSLQKLGFLPEVQNDMIFSVICEEMGLMGAVLLMLLFLCLLWRILCIAIEAANDVGMLLTTGILIHIGLQVLLNIAVVTNSIPNTGISLPFISYGGSSILFLLTEMGIVFRVSSESKQTE